MPFGQVDVLKGHDFSRAARKQIVVLALATEGRFIHPQTFSPWLKPHLFRHFYGTAEAVPFQGRDYR
jgi:hypothetical protein